MKKINLILNAVLLTSMMITSFVVSGQIFVDDSYLPEIKERESQEQRLTERAMGWQSTNSGQEFAADKPLRFVMMIGMTNLPGDKESSMCYSNVITVPGPAGWGEKGWLPAGSAEQARKTIESYKQQFCTACEKSSGRKITSIGNFTYVMNQYEDQEEVILKSRPTNPESFTVILE